MAKAKRGGKYATSNNIIQFPQKEKSADWEETEYWTKEGKWKSSAIGNRITELETAFEKSSSQRTAAAILRSVDVNLQNVETALLDSDNDTSYLLTYRRRLRALRNKIIKSERL